MQINEACKKTKSYDKQIVCRGNNRTIWCRCEKRTMQKIYEWNENLEQTITKHKKNQMP